MSPPSDATITAHLLRLEGAMALAYRLAIAHHPWLFQVLTSNVISHQRRVVALQGFHPHLHPALSGPNGCHAWLVRLAMPIVHLAGSAAIMAWLLHCEERLMAAYARASGNRHSSRMLQLLLLTDLLPAQRRSRDRLGAIPPTVSNLPTLSAGLAAGVLVAALMVIGTTAPSWTPGKTPTILVPQQTVISPTATRMPVAWVPVVVSPAARLVPPPRPATY